MQAKIRPLYPPKSIWAAMYVSFYPPSKEKVGPIAQLRRLRGKNRNRKRVMPLYVLASGIGQAGGGIVDRDFPKLLIKRPRGLRHNRVGVI
jgi:hypothetical protein